MPAYRDPAKNKMLQHSEFFTHNLQFNYLPVHFNSPDFEVNPYRADVAFSIGVVLLASECSNVEK